MLTSAFGGAEQPGSKNAAAENTRNLTHGARNNAFLHLHGKAVLGREEAHSINASLPERPTPSRASTSGQQGERASPPLGL